jgi:hypothetical protein
MKTLSQFITELQAKLIQSKNTLGELEGMCEQYITPDAILDQILCNETIALDCNTAFLISKLLQLTDNVEYIEQVSLDMIKSLFETLVVSYPDNLSYKIEYYFYLKNVMDDEIKSELILDEIRILFESYQRFVGREFNKKM